MLKVEETDRECVSGLANVGSRRGVAIHLEVRKEVVLCRHVLSLMLVAVGWLVGWYLLFLNATCTSKEGGFEVNATSRC